MAVEWINLRDPPPPARNPPQRFACPGKPKSAPAPSKIEVKFFDRFLHRFFAVLDPFWTPFWPPKSTPKASKNRSPKRPPKNIDFRPVLGSLWIPKMYKNQWFLYIFEGSRCSNLHPKNGPKIDPKRTPKSIKNRSGKPSEKYTSFFTDFGRFWLRFGPPKGAQNFGKNMKIQ